MKSSGGVLNFTNSAPIQGLELANNGWALASLIQTTDLDTAADVFVQDNIKSQHTLSNIAKVWGYSNTWQSFTPSSKTGDLTNMAKGRAFWFLLQNLNTDTVQISPSGAVGGELVIGGSTTLTPPNSSQVANSISQLSRSKLNTISAYSSSVSTHAVCDAANQGTVIGYATAFSLSGGSIKRF